MVTAGQTIDTPTLPQLFKQFKIATGRMVFIRMKRGMVFVMLALFGSCVYTGTFFYLNLIEESEGMPDSENTSVCDILFKFNHNIYMLMWMNCHFIYVF